MIKNHSNINLKSQERPLVIRSSLKQLKKDLPNSTFIQPHRSYIINIEHIQSWDKSSISIANNVIPISRNNKEAILNQLDSFYDEASIK